MPVQTRAAKRAAKRSAKQDAAAGPVQPPKRAKQAAATEDAGVPYFPGDGDAGNGGVGHTFRLPRQPAEDEPPAKRPFMLEDAAGDAAGDAATAVEDAAEDAGGHAAAATAAEDADTWIVSEFPHGESDGFETESDGFESESDPEGSPGNPIVIPDDAGHAAARPFEDIIFDAEVPAGLRAIGVLEEHSSLTRLRIFAEAYDNRRDLLEEDVADAVKLCKEVLALAEENPEKARELMDFARTRYWEIRNEAAVVGDVDLRDLTDLVDDTTKKVEEASRLAAMEVRAGELKAVHAKLEADLARCLRQCDKYAREHGPTAPNPYVHALTRIRDDIDAAADDLAQLA